MRLPKARTKRELMCHLKRTTPEARFRQHRDNARRRGIPFKLSWEEWWAWWSEDDRWARRGCSGKGIVMGRYGDLGAYEVGNITPTVCGDNVGQANVRRTNMVGTPKGMFLSAMVAGDHHGISSNTASRWARDGLHGWSYLDLQAFQSNSQARAAATA